MAGDIYSKAGADAVFLHDTAAGRQALAQSPEITGTVAAAAADAVGKDSTVVAAAQAAAGSVTPAIVAADLATRSGLPKSTVFASPAFAIVDEKGRRSWLEFNSDGSPTPESAALIDKAVNGDRAFLSKTNTAVTPSITIVDELGRRSWLEIGPDGAPTANSLALLASKGVGPIVGPTGAVLASTSLADVAVFGDSTTRCSNREGQGWPVLLSGMIGRTIANYGSSGTRMPQIAAKIGALSITGYVTGGTIPADISTAVTLYSFSPLAPLGSVDTESYPVRMRLRDGSTVDGIIRQKSTDITAVEFVRATAGSAITTNGQVELYSLVAQSAKTIILSGGINDESEIDAGTRTADDVLGEYAAAASILSPLKPRLMVWGPLDRGYDERPGTAHGDYIRAVERGLRRLFGSNVCEVRRYLASPQALTDATLFQPGFTPTSQDNTDVGAGTVPQSFRDTGSVHLNVLGYQLQARYMYRWLTSPLKGWY